MITKTQPIKLTLTPFFSSVTIASEIRKYEELKKLREKNQQSVNPSDPNSNHNLEWSSTNW